MSGLQSLKNLILEAKKELGEISEDAIMKLSDEDNLIYKSLWALVNAYAWEENKPACFKWLENHKFSLSNIRWTETDQKHYNTVMDGLKYAYEVLVNNKLLDMAKDISLALDWLPEFKEKMYALARKEVEYDVSTCGRRGRMGGVPQEFSEKAEEYQKGIKPPYDADDIISAYESGMMKEKEMNDEKIPRNIEEAIAGLDSLISMEDREYLKENGSVAVHHTLGRYIRNEWGLWTGSELKSELEKKGLTHPDDMSDYIIREYIDVLKAREADEAGRG